MACWAIVRRGGVLARYGQRRVARRGLETGADSGTWSIGSTVLPAMASGDPPGWPKVVGRSLDKQAPLSFDLLTEAFHPIDPRQKFGRESLCLVLDAAPTPLPVAFSRSGGTRTKKLPAPGRLPQKGAAVAQNGLGDVWPNRSTVAI